MPVVQLALQALQAVVHALLAALVWLQAVWRAAAASCRAAGGWAAAAAPALRPLVAALCGPLPREHVGNRPRPPTVLGVAVAEDIADADWPAAAEALGRLLAWAHDQGFRLVLIYQPGGRLQEPTGMHQLELQLLQQRLCGVVQLQSGWRPGVGVNGVHGRAGAAAGSLRAVLLSAVDGEWPLLAAAARTGPGSAAAGAAAGSLAPGQPRAQGSSSWAAAIDTARDTAIDTAIAAPERVRAGVEAAAGPLAACEPDFVLVCGPALTLAGFPAWAVRASEMYHIGPLAALQGRQPLDAALLRFGGTKQRWGQ